MFILWKKKLFLLKRCRGAGVVCAEAQNYPAAKRCYFSKGTD